MSKFIPITPTSLNTMKTCPKQFEAKYITKEVEFKETPATIWGNEVHKAMELNLKDNTPLPPTMAFLLPWVERFKATDGELYSETKLAVDSHNNPTDWYNRYLGGIVDVMIVNKEKGTAFIGDLKTGKYKPDETQLTILIKCAFATFPEVTKINASLFYPHINQVMPMKARRDTFEPVTLMRDIRNNEAELEAGTFMPRPNGLCRQWCDVFSCPHNGRNK
ncbi:hypothetical protein V757_02280 [Pelistega indica]|uniref:PD-(D/E)XK endonuclease-like domain-containing protein n=1 Tax=Pelistega indica TaxID=1414851 RepID=V8G9K0_9BURK|nr:PD-(D/E)XK nuclease family protein [Pelistega indica]ETD72786.1 hypothetical protein V757_02280 [Pelistega indica]